MKIIVGLGNPGQKYENTRHNVGFLFVDALQQQHEFPEFSPKKKFFAEVTEKIFLNNEKIVLVKPDTFMNNSGRAVGAIMNYYNIETDDLIVVHDDLDIEIGHYKRVRDIRAAGHNGIQDIIEYIGTQDFMRIRIGVETKGSRKNRGEISGKKFVLQNFDKKEQAEINTVIDQIIQELF
ncbi:MAG: aminoacyl-tRNA hydrolase [Candidatus Moraniibacteriota bacterium]|nr:MAG: aminoacyl-tRNA hydrolase [Candidatus Moranbacteria bacterium]